MSPCFELSSLLGSEILSLVVASDVFKERDGCICMSHWPKRKSPATKEEFFECLTLENKGTPFLRDARYPTVWSHISEDTNHHYHYNGKITVWSLGKQFVM
jgi:hypothetical protein